VPKRFAAPKSWLIALGAALAALYVLSARRLPVGILNDDAANILLARALLHGTYSFPGGMGRPEEFMPGMPVLLALPAALVAPHWRLLSAIPLLCAALAVFLTWRLARRFMGPEAAGAVALLVALNPVLVGLGGLVMPYLPSLALTLALLDAADARGTRALGLLALGLALATLLRPYGALLAVCMAVPLAHRGRGRDAGLILAAGLLPLAAWSLRNRLTPGASPDYFGSWRSRVASIGTPALELRHAADIAARVFGEGLLGLSYLPYAARAAAGVLALAAAAYGAARLLKRAEDDARAFAFVAYPACLLLVHLTWPIVSTRYMFSFAPFVWIMIGAAAEPFFARRRVLARAATAVAALAALSFDLSFAVQGFAAPGAYIPNTVAWMREHVPANSRLYAEKNYALALATGRACGPVPIVQHVLMFNASARYDAVDRVLIQPPRAGDEFLESLPKNYENVLAARLLSMDGVAERRDPDEGTLLIRLDSRAP
jgi:hypothetical protein